MKNRFIHFIRKFFPVKKHKIIGKNNKIYVNGIEYKKHIPGMKIEITGNNNVIRIADKNIFINCKLSLKCNESEIRFGKALPNMKIENLWVYANDFGKNQRLIIGDNALIRNTSITLSEENSSVYIGNNCMISDGSIINGTDSHSIIDINTGKCINHVSGPVIIGDHCWLGHGVIVLKKTQIPNNTVCGMGSVITKKFTKEHTVLAGNPARVIRENVDWNYMPLHSYKDVD